MTLRKHLVFSVFMNIALLAGFPGSDSRNFPLKGCTTDDIDVIFLYLNDLRQDYYQMQFDMCSTFTRKLLRMSEITKASRVMVVGVTDNFSVNNPNVNVSTWKFLPYLKVVPYGSDNIPDNIQEYRNVQETIDVKIKFVQRLFSQLGGVRDNATRVAVLFMNGRTLTDNDVIQIPSFVEQQVTDINIFVVVLKGNVGNKVIRFSDMIIVDNDYEYGRSETFFMSICNQCDRGWWTLEHSVGIYSKSCYKIFQLSLERNTDPPRSYCPNYQAPVAIETHEELNFLRSKIYSYLKLQNDNNGNIHNTTHFSFSGYIGLIRDTDSVAKRFRWKKGFISNDHPLVINNWLNGNPSGGKTKPCSLWQFNWTNHATINESINTVSSIDRWIDTECLSPLATFIICETSVPRPTDVLNQVRIEAAAKEKYNKALTKGNFVEFRDNIVSVSANIARTEFLQSTKQIKEKLFPLFDCGEDEDNPRYISYLYVCDNINHCNNRRDEYWCVFKSSGTSTSDDNTFCTQNCYGVYCCDGSCLPLQYVNDGEVDCNICDHENNIKGNDETGILNLHFKKNKTCALYCNHVYCLTFERLNDSSIHCRGLVETIGKLERADTCYNILGHYIWAPMCVYVRDMYGAMLGCRDLSHLVNCTSFECPEGYFKCPNSYCIPQHYVYNGQSDCPTGEDELLYSIAPCVGNFACWDSSMCLHPDLVCNGHPDCPNKDDEVDCKVWCNKALRCVSGTVTVTGNFSTHQDVYVSEMYKTTYLDLSNIDMNNDNIMVIVLSFLIDVIVFNLSNSSLKDLSLCNYQIMDQLQVLDVTYNHIKRLDGRDFVYPTIFHNLRNLNLSYNKEFVALKYLNLRYLETLDLSHTSVSDLDQSILGGFRHLKYVFLRFTKISKIHQQTFGPNRILQTLDVRDLVIGDFYEDFFVGLTVSQHLHTDNFEMCCPQIRGPNIQFHVCHAPGNAISSCFDLLGSNVQRILLWAVAIFAVLGNTTVIVFRFILDRSHLRTGYGLFVINLGISDLVMGIYLFIIIGADYYYRDIYILNDKKWRESSVCSFSGFLAFLSSETSTMCIFLVTVDRFLIMKFPFGQVRFSGPAKIISLIMSWITGFLLALTPIVFKFEIFSSNAMCLGLPLTTKRLNGWEFSFGVFIVLNVFLSLLLASGQRAIFRAMTENRISGAGSSTSPRRAADIVVAKQLSLVAMSNFICWFPIGFMGILSLGGHEISNEVYSWITVIVLPVNSAANPVLYTIPVIMDKWEKFKSGSRKLK